MSRKIIFATSNEGKMKEIRVILADLDVQVISLKEAGIHGDIEENGTTFEENAIIKARAICEMTGQLVLADDSGLEVDFLNREPGIYSARYLGEETSYVIKNKTIIDRLAGVEGDRRSARFVCAIAAVFPEGRIITSRGTLEGRISEQAAGAGGFGYDPIFYVPEYDKTAAELSMEEKNLISHRGKALEGIKRELKSIYEEKET